MVFCHGIGTNAPPRPVYTPHPHTHTILIPETCDYVNLPGKKMGINVAGGIKVANELTLK